MQRIYGSVLVALLMGGCSQWGMEGPKLDKSVEKKVKGAQTYANHGRSGSVENSWLAGFRSNTLSTLAKDALRHNPDLKVAYYRIIQAQAQVEYAQSALKPSVGYSGTTHHSTTDIPALQKINIGGIGVSWEPDVWGKVAAGVRASQASEKAVEASYDFARQSLVANTSKAWFIYVQANQQVKLYKEIVRSYESIAKNVKTKFDVGQVTIRQVAQANAEVQSAKDALLKIENGREQAARSLQILLGKYPSAKMQRTYTLPRLPKFPRIGVPANLLERRPDIIAKEEAMRAAFNISTEARLARLPSFPLSLGLQSTSADSFFTTLAAGIVGPIYTGGAIEANIKSADAAQKQTMYAYQSAVYDAFKEVETTLGNEANFKKRSVVLAKAIKEYQTSVTAALDQYNVGKVDLTTVLIQQTKLFGAKLSKLALESELMQNRVNLYLALGGGFDNKNATGVKQ